MKVRKNALSRVIAFLMAVLLVVGLVPVNTMGTVEAFDSNKTKKVEAGSNEIYICGVDSAKDATVNEDNYVIEYETTATDAPVLYVGGEKVDVSDTDPVVEYDEGKITLDKEWTDTQKLWMAVSFGVEFEEFDKKDIEIKNNSKTFDGEAVEAVEVEVKNATNEDVILYSTNGGKTFSTSVPKIKNVEKVNVIVKVVRPGYTPYISDEITVEVTAAKLDRSGVKVEGYENTYNPEDPQEAKAFTITGYDAEKDTVWFRVDDGDYTQMAADGSNIPTVKTPTEMNIDVKITRDNYEDYKVGVKAVVKAANFKENAVKVPKYDKNPVYDEEKTYDIIPGDIEGLVEGDKVWYAEEGSENWISEEPTVKDAGTYKYLVKIEREYHNPYIEEITVTVDKAVQEVKFIETPEEITYKEANTFTYTVEEVAAGSTVEYSLDKASKEIASIDSKTGEVTFNAVGEIKVTATVTNPNYEDASAAYSVDIVYVDAPEIEESKGANGSRYFSDKHKYTVKSAEEGWEITLGSNALGQKDKWAEQVNIESQKKYENLKVAFRNTETGEITDLVAIKDIVVDTTNPEIVEFEFVDKNEGVIATIIRKLTFGLFCKEAVEVKVATTDTPDIPDIPGVTKEDIAKSSTGVKEIKLYKYTEGSEAAVILDAESIKDNVAVFEIEVGFRGIIKAEVIDNADNTSGEVLANCNNSNIGDKNIDGYIMIENIAPTFIGPEADEKLTPVLVSEEETSVKLGEDAVYSGDVKFDFTVQDNESGLYSVVATINGVKVLNEAYAAKEDGLKEYSYTIDTVGRTADTEGKFDVSVVVIDNAGNVSEDACTIYKDTTYPSITGFEFNVKDEKDANIESKGNEFVDKEILVKDYGFYFKEEVTVTIEAADVASKNEMATGVDTITYKVDDISKGIVEEKTVSVDENNKITFTVPANFKGQIYAYATDKVGNNPLNSTKHADYDDAVVDDKGFVHPEGTVVEDAAQHEETSSIEITVPETASTQLNKFEYAYGGSAQMDKDMHDNATEVPLYNKDLSFTINVTDTYSGIENVKWTVVDGKGSGEVTEIESDKDIKNLEEAGWTVTKEAESNLVIGLEKEIAVSGNTNDMVLLVELTDNAGNVSYDFYQFGIDKNAPVVSVEYTDKASGDASYFDAGRKATVTVKDYNFNKEDIIVSAVRVDDEGKSTTYTPEIKWSKTTGEGHDTAYTGTITYTNDGDYTFEVVSCTDRATNKITDNQVDYKGEAPQKFTIDKVDPTISVSYNNNSAQNGKYFKAHRTATIVVKEHNFDVDRVDVTLTARKNGAAINVPNVSWKHKGNVHTATIAYNNDGDYTFDIEMTDKAGRKNKGVNYGNSVAEKEFTVDTTITDPTIGGVKNGNAYTDKVVPTIKFDDINFDTVEVKLVRTTKGNKNVDVTNEFIKGLSKNSQGGSGTFDTFKKIAENDGIYTLTVKMTDMAGNQSDESVTFTVNRYGSVYVFDDYLASLQDAYVKEVNGDIILTEYNASRLVKDSVKIEITKDGQPIANPVYKVAPVINDQVSVGSSGWYQYEYTIAASNFADDGVYRITVSSEDAAGNKPETENYEDCEMLFSVDSTPAEITNISGLEEAIVNADSLEFNFEVFDAIGLKSVTVYVNDEVVEVFDNMDDLINFMGSYTLSAGSNQKIRIVVEDLAGNITDTSADDFGAEYTFNDTVTVSTNFFVRWFANKPLFIGSIAGIVAVAGGLIWFFVGKRKKEDEE